LRWAEVLLRLSGHVQSGGENAGETRELMGCVRCGSEATRRDGRTRLGGQRWRCGACWRRFTGRSGSAFSRRCFPDDVIALAGDRCADVV